MLWPPFHACWPWHAALIRYALYYGRILQRYTGAALPRRSRLAP